MWKRGQLPVYQLPTGTVIIDPPEVRSPEVRTVAVCALVSSSENKASPGCLAAEWVFT
jgi:hypothetical protein